MFQVIYSQYRSQIETAIKNMDDTQLDREGIDKLLLLLPTSEEIATIKEQESLYPTLPLGDAEQFLLLLHSLPSIEARLKLWAFKSDFKTMEREMWQPLKDLKMGIEAMKSSATLHMVLSVVRSMGNILNKKEVKGFQLDYLAKLASVRDTSTKKSLIVHIVASVRDNLPSSTDLHSELEPLVGVSRTNYTDLSGDLASMERECKAAVAYMTAQGREGGTVVPAFLEEASKRIKALQVAEKKMTKRWTACLAWLGLPPHLHAEYPPHGLAKTITDFSLQFKQEWDKAEAAVDAGEVVTKENSGRSKRRSAPDLGRADEGDLER